ncbi:PAS domain S-box protein [Oscillatoria salina]|uniref:PAS domain S-box protein n=1 Tax=Oscillatoria salina TaxID=331517 RepID=UPI001CCE5C23|nr:PAS domain S-box protein [Oscillatoria salina]MBZ8179156.1 PAS domain S-box protein [Oscillatoria salina IIICB1]
MVNQMVKFTASDTSVKELLNRESLHLYRSALAATSCGVAIADARQAHRPIVYCNQAFEEITGYSRAEVIGRNCKFLQGSDTDPIAIEQIRAALKVGGECQVVIKNYKKDGTPFWNELKISPVRDEQGNLTHFVGVQTDITKRKQEEETRRLMEFSLARAADAAFFIAPEGRLLYVNEAACRLLGYSQGELQRMSISEIDLQFPPKVWSQHWQKIKQHGSFTVETEHRAKDGRLIPVEVTVNYLEFHNREYNCAFVRDISDRYLAQAELRRNEKLYRTLAQNIPNGFVLIFDSQLRYLLAEGKGMEDIGLSKEFLEGKTLEETSSPHEYQTFASVYQAALQGKTTVWEYEYRSRVLSVQIVPVIDDDDKIVAGMVMTQDITQQKETETALRSLVEREKLVGEVAQRIRQSLKLDDVLKTAVREVRQLLQSDRVILYRFNPDWSGAVVVESVGAGWTPALGSNVEDRCFQVTHAPLYRKGRIRAIENIYDAGLTECHLNLLAQFEVKANLIVPVLQGEKLWGLIVVHHCSKPRRWQDGEIELLRQLSVQLAIAIQQAALFEQVETELKERAIAEAALRTSEAQLKEQATRLKKALKELKQTQTQLIQSEKMSSLGQLVAGIAHEINNPVSFIRGNIAHATEYAHDLLDLLQLYQQCYPQPKVEIQDKIEETDLDFLTEDFVKLLQSMKVGTDRINSIVISLRNFSRLDEAERKPADLHEGLENTLMILHHRLHGKSGEIKVIKNYGNIPEVECYPGQLNQVFINLLSNAIDALEDSEISAPMIEICTEVSKKNSKSAAVIRIKDNGSGISQEIKKQIFDPFFTTKPVGKGTGLGLSICYQIVVNKHQGKIDCFSTPGKGTEFVVTIPLQEGSN